jgi:CDP-6-deoxy-D-xylo-4-hexulose-3-dehydrase
MFYGLASTSWDAAEIDAVNAVIESDRYTMGPRVAEFEAAFAAYMGMKHGVMVNSGSSANLLATAAYFFKKDRPLQRGDEAIVPAIAWATTYYPLHQYGLKMRVVDVELDTLNVDMARLEAALTDRTRMIAAVSILGNPAALDVMRALADKHGLYLMEDNCESLDAELDGRKTGTFGDLNTFSFFFSHHIATMEGGMVVTDDDELADIVRSLRAHGWTRDLGADSPVRPQSGEQLYEAYRFILPGYNVRPTELSGAIGLVQLDKLADMTARRRENLALFRDLFAGDERFIIPRENGKSSTFSFPIVLNPDAGISKAEVFEALQKADIEFRLITGGNIMRHDVVKWMDIEAAGPLANADTVHDFGFFVGNHPHDLTPQLKRLREVLVSVGGR